MGTRGLTMVISEGQTKVAQYGQWDHYPSGQGITALKFLSKLMKKNKSGQIKLPLFKKKVDKLCWLTKEQTETIDKLPDFEFESLYTYLGRDWGAQILEAILTNKLTKTHYTNEAKTVRKFKILGLVDHSTFAGDSLFCEWAYVVDLDKMTFEVYQGVNEDKPLTEEDRFFYLMEEAVKKHKSDVFYPVKMIASFDLNNLPSEIEFLTITEPKNEEENSEVVSNENKN